MTHSTMAEYRFRLTLLQRVLNPPSRLLFVAMAVAGPSPLILISVLKCDIVMVLLSLTASGPFFWLCWNSVASLVASVRGITYPNQVAISTEHISFGHDTLEFSIENDSALKVAPGLAGTSIIVNAMAGYAIVIPRTIVKSDELRSIVGDGTKKGLPASEIEPGK